MGASTVPVRDEGRAPQLRSQEESGQRARCSPGAAGDPSERPRFAQVNCQRCCSRRR